MAHHRKKHDVIHKIKRTWRNPTNAGGGPSHSHRQYALKIWWRSHMWFRRYFRGQTDTDTLITILRNCSRRRNNNEVGRTVQLTGCTKRNNIRADDLRISLVSTTDNNHSHSAVHIWHRPLLHRHHNNSWQITWQIINNTQQNTNIILN